jgi:Tfp pilus assembly protein PilZ
MKMMAESHIVIAEHGGFQSNMVYMRNGSLFVELRGNYTHG